MTREEKYRIMEREIIPLERKLHQVVYRSLKRILGNADPRDVEDIVQDVMHSTWNNLDTYNGSSSIKTWVYGIMNKKILDYDLYNDNVYYPHSPSLVRGLRYGEYEDPDGEGYIYQGEYVYPLGPVSSMPAFISLLVGSGWDVAKAAATAKAVYDFSMSYFEISGTQWYKTDEIYDYSKRIETVYEYLSGNGQHALGSYTIRQKKRI